MNSQQVYFDTEPGNTDDKINSNSVINQKLVAVIDKQRQKHMKDNSATVILKLNQNQKSVEQGEGKAQAHVKRNKIL